ncbi:MAG: response regulator transcription factor [Bryobacterales bacterium]|nr:response regulator transcription factor [Bryobacterales bacterium]
MKRPFHSRICEREILRLIAEGRTNKEVANELNLSLYTVDNPAAGPTCCEF